MELRACSQVHFISVIRDGEVMKLLNIARGKSTLKFKNIEQIYASDGHASLAKHPPKVIRSLAAPYGTHKIKTECMEDENELDFGTVTLKQLKQTCKMKKRKPSKSVKAADVKQENDFHCEEDEQELKETLFSLKRKVFKKAKTKKRRLFKQDSLDFETKNTSDSSQSAPCSLALLDISSEICLPLKIKVEDPELDYSEPLAGCFSFWDDPMSSTSETEESVQHSSADSAVAGTLINPQSGQYSHKHEVDAASLGILNCCLNQGSYELREHVRTENWFALVDSELEEIKDVHGSMVTDDQHSVSCKSDLFKHEDSTDPVLCDEIPERVLFVSDSSNFQAEFPHDYAIEDTHGRDSSAKSQAPCTGTASEIQNEVLAGIYNLPGQQSLEQLQAPLIGVTGITQNDELMSHGGECLSMDDNKDTEEIKCSSVRDCNLMVNNTSFILVNGVASLDSFTSTVENQESSLLDTPMYETKDIESELVKGRMEDCCSHVDDEHIPSVMNVASSSSTAGIFEDKQSSGIDKTIAPLTCSPNIQIGVEEPKSLVANEGNETKMMPHPPGRLFSARKTISPMSQERLRNAMSSTELEDGAEIHSYEEQLMFEKNEVKFWFPRSDFKRVRTILTSQTQEAMQAAGPANGRQMMRKGKEERRVRYSKGTANGAHASQLAGSPCSTIQSCSQNAIAFSQQQMSDFERLTKKLVVQLQSMKAIVVDGMHYESRMGAKFRYNTDEVRMAVENVTKVEESTKKMLGIMTKDCNRFCKIMRLAEANAPSPVKNISQESKERLLAEPYYPSPGKKVHKVRKIVFADEAGGSLCNVRYFQDIKTDPCVADLANSEITKG